MSGQQAAGRVNPPDGPTFGDVVSATSRPTSKIEDTVKEFLRGSGFRVARGPMGVVCHHPDNSARGLTLAPDIVLRDLWLAIEVDPCGPVGSRGFSHAGAEERDRIRNDLLGAVGWTVIRLRLGATEGAQIGDRDIVSESPSFTKAVASALLEAIEDFREQRPPRVRFVPKGKSPAAAKRRSHVVNIGLDRYSDDTYWFTWYPDLDSAASYRFRLAANGRYLYGTNGSGSVFIEELGLHEVDRAGWKQLLTEYLANKAPADLQGTTKWPWGDNILIPANEAASDDPLVVEVISASDHEKQTIDRIDFWFTVSGHHIGDWAPHELRRDYQTPIVAVHPAATNVGYRIADVASERRAFGPYQRITVTRACFLSVEPEGDGS